MVGRSSSGRTNCVTGNRRKALKTEATSFFTVLINPVKCETHARRVHNAQQQQQRQNHQRAAAHVRRDNTTNETNMPDTEGGAPMAVEPPPSERNEGGRPAAENEDDDTVTTKKQRKERAEAVSSVSTPAGDRDVLELLECTVCTELLLDPVTTSCGHTFCRACLRQSMDHNTRCPVCRTVLLLNHSAQLPVNVTLAALMSKLLPEAMKARRDKADEDAAAVGGRTAGDDDLEGNLPMFVMDVMLPGQAMQLNIFEPRYRLLIRRCMEGGVHEKKP